MSVIYPKWKENALQNTANNDLDGTGATGVYAALVDTALYTYNASHEFYSSVVAGQVGTPVELTAKTYTAGQFDAADATWTAVTGASCEAIVLYVKNAGANTTWRLFAYIDSATGLPVTPSGADITVAWNASGIAQL